MVHTFHREQHIGQYKSLTAAAQVAQLNPVLNHRVHGLTLKVGAETEQTFNGAFWAQTVVVITALVWNYFLILNVALLILDRSATLK